MRRLILLVLSGFCLAADPSDPKELQKEAKALAKQGVSGIPRLAEMIYDASPAVRAQAVRSLVDIGSTQSLNPLLQSTADGDPQIQMAAINGIVNFYLPGYVQGRVKKTGSRVAGLFVEAGQQIVPPDVVARPEVIARLVKLIDEGNNQVRATAARAAGVLRGREAVDALTAALRSKDDDLLFESVSAIEKIRDSKPAASLAILFRDPKEHVQVAALETAGLLNNPIVVPDLERTLTFSLTPKARRAALGALGRLSHESSRSLFERNLQDKDDGVRAAAAEGVARLRRPSDLPRMESLFKGETKMEARLAQAFALVNLGRQDMAEFSPLKYLTDSLNSKFWGGVAEAYLIELTRQPAILHSVEAIALKGPKDEKIRTARVLAASGDRNTIAKVEALSKDPDVGVAEESLRALRAMKARLP